ncbi:MAG: hypothetical protein ACKVJE_02930 [Pseudomonadales bacterium]
MDNFIDAINLDSLTALNGCKLEPELGNAEVGRTIQFERLGYFCKDPDSRDKPIFERL